MIKATLNYDKAFQLWCQFAASALAGVATTDLHLDDAKSINEIINRAAKFAGAMVAEISDRVEDGRL